MKFIRILFLPVFLLGNLACFGQTDTSLLNKTVTSLQKYEAANPVEKVYLHLARQNYFPGDTIWFKAYTVAGQNHGLSAISNVLHVELLTERDSVISRIALPLMAGIGWGDFALPVLTPAGTYQVRAYTNWMRNFAPDYFFDQLITVTDPQTSLAYKKQKNTASPDVQFFPEGGGLIIGQRSKVAVKSVSPNGLGEDLSGSVVDNDGTEVAVFTTQHLGMGIFALTPQAGKIYHAKITLKDGRQFTAELPKAGDDGFTMAINNSQADTLSVRIAASGKVFALKKDAGYYLIAQAGGKAYYMAGFKLSAQSFNAVIDKKRFPTGIVQFTLFAQNGEPLNERIVFIRHDDQLKVSISSLKQVYTTREKVDLAIKVTDNDGKPVNGSFSVAVINQDLAGLNKWDESTIINNLLLTSDLKGFVEQPNYYFTNVTDKTNADLDVLMLTQGYHRFEWKQVVSGNYPALNYEPESSLTLSGNLKTNSGKPIPKGKVMLYTTKGGWFKLDTLTDENGSFTFKGLITDVDTTLIYVIQGRSATNKKNLIITLDTIAPFRDWKSKARFNAVRGDTVTETAYQKQVKQQFKLSLDKRVISLKEVVIKEQKASFREALNPDQTIIGFPEEPTGQTLSQFLATRVKGINFMDGIPYTQRAILRTKAGMPPPPMSIKLDGAFISNEIFLMLNLNDIEAVDVLRTSGNIDIVSGRPEVLLLTSRKHRGYTKQVTPDVVTYSSDGFYKVRAFYLPKYEGLQKRLNNQDLRNTIYWKPDMITDREGNTSFSFFNSDTRGNYRIVLEGIDGDGNISHINCTYRVN